MYTSFDGILHTQDISAMKTNISLSQVFQCKANIYFIKKQTPISDCS